MRGNGVADPAGLPRLLLVTPQFPFPPRSGFTTRVYQLLRQTSERFDVTVLSYVGSRDDGSAVSLEEELAVSVEVVPRRVSLVRKRLAQASSLLSRQPYHSRELFSAEMQAAIDRLSAHGRFAAVQLESSALCCFRFPRELPVVLDEHNIEYEVFQRLRARERSLPRRLFHRVEHVRFRRLEHSAWQRVAGCALTSTREQEIVRRHAPMAKTAVVPNGVDTGYFQPSAIAPESRTLLFVGRLDYRPNLDAAYHLAEEIWPLVVQRCPDARLTIVGRGPQSVLHRLRRAGAFSTGEVADVRPYLAKAAVVGVPVRMGGGTRLKVLDALAMAKPVVSTTVGCEGIDVQDREHLLVADGAADFAAAVVALFDDASTAVELGRAGRSLVERRYSWDLAGTRLTELYQDVGVLDRSAR